MQQGIKQRIKQVLHLMGLEVHRYYAPPPEPDPVQQPNEIFSRENVAKHYNISTVLDVGANGGQYGQRLRESGYTGRVISFEPIPDVFAGLQHRASADPLWSCHNCALGHEQGTAEIHIAGNSAESSSLLDMEQAHLDAAPTSAYIDKQNISIKRLDDVYPEYVGANENVWLKLDVQGFEMNVLRGGMQSLAKVKVVEVELSLVPLYKDGPLICDMISFLNQQGFTLVWLEPNFCDAQFGYAMQMDGVFVKQNTL